ncbi:type IV secretory pathway VirB3-like protein [Micromonospora jinlongensis]|uniref:Type IV secretory pathway VirB3-like protein n=1 Tax=Micromonospora jinlongensis TaxID=1287877 RepID=A0A7Y9X4C7_9ACTN|nr:type IV secretory pathway VirB3-like protein [Micromonospora jinlongensis]
MSSAAPTAPDAAPEQAFRLADQVNRRPQAVRLLAAVRRHRLDLLAALVCAVLAGWVTHGLWPDPAGRTLALNPEDQALYEWFLAVDARALLGDFGLLTDRLNAPDGVNLMTNTSVIALGIVFAPVTLLLGAPVTFALLAAANLAGTAFAWYLLFHRTLRARRLAAALGGGLCGFGPGMISQTNSHLHMTAQWLVPVIVWLVARLLRASDPGPTTLDGAGRGRSPGPDRRRMLTSAAGLAAAVTAQVFIGEEVLFLAAVVLLVMAISYAVADRELARRALPGFAGGLAVAAGLALLVLGYPLWFQFAGPQGVADGMFTPAYFSADLSSWWTISPLSVAGSDQSARLTTGPAEYNTFLGWPLLLVSAVCAIWVGRRRLVLACVVAGLVMGALSLGPEVVLGGTRTALPGPYALIGGLPVVDGALPMRFALALLPIIATLLVLAVDRALRSTGRARRLVPLAVGAALLPIFPTPLPTAERPAVPEFVSGGHWRQCVRPGGVLVPVPLPTPKEPWPMRWATTADAAFGLPEGFFIGPYGRGGTAAMGTFKQPTSALLADVARRGDQPAIGDEQRRQAARDAEFWGASCIALADDAPHAESLRTTLEQLYGPATRIADAWIWRV